MKTIIAGLQIPDNPLAFSGLKSSTISRLPELAIFTGPNGGGKSRLLRLIAGQAPAQNAALSQFRRQIQTSQRARDQILTRLKTNIGSPTEDNLRKQIENIDQQIRQLEHQTSTQATFEYDKTLDGQPICLYFAPNITAFSNPDQLTFGQAASFLNQGGTLRNIVGSFQNSLLTIQSLVSNYLISRSDVSQYAETESSELKRKFESFRELLNALLGMEITWTAGPAISIDGTPLNQISNNFSQGQKWLLHFATTAYADVTLEDPLVLCIDEPELHLHPAALNQIVDVLKRVLAHGQILIATHSIPLIAYVGYENTWFVSAGAVTYAGRHPEVIIRGLVGGPAGVHKLKSLLDEPDAAAVSRFAFESLLSPTVVAAKSHDPQGKQILRSLDAKRVTLGRPVRVLDYGAGKGRLLDIADDEIGNELPSLFDYKAFDPTPENADICRATIARVYGSADGRYFSAKSGIAETLAGQQFDVTVLCNVVHEISPLDWRGEFSFIGTLLEEGGEMLIVEDLFAAAWRGCASGWICYCKHRGASASFQH